MQQGWENMQESAQHYTPTEDFSNSHKSTISRKSDFGDLLVTKEEILEFFLNGDHQVFHTIVKNHSIHPIDSPLHHSHAYIVREIIPVIQNFIKTAKILDKNLLNK